MGRKRKITRKNKRHKSKRKYKRRKIKRKYTKKRKYIKRVKKGGGVIKPKNVEELQLKLNKYGISTDTWNKESGNKSVEQLLKEIKSGDSILIEEDGTIYRSVRVANVIVLSDDNKYRLIEQSHLNKKGEVVKERGNNVLSEKMEPNETLTNAIIRGVKEELGEKYSNNIMFLDEEKSNVENIEKSSYSYPGLKAMYSFYEKTIKIPLLTLDFPPPETFVTEEKNSDGSFKRYIVWNWGVNN
jgi:hypothetical protein